MHTRKQQQKTVSDVRSLEKILMLFCTKFNIISSIQHSITWCKWAFWLFYDVAIYMFIYKSEKVTTEISAALSHTIYPNFTELV